MWWTQFPLFCWKYLIFYLKYPAGCCPSFPPVTTRVELWSLSVKCYLKLSSLLVCAILHKLGPGMKSRYIKYNSSTRILTARENVFSFMNQLKNSSLHCISLLCICHSPQSTALSIKTEMFEVRQNIFYSWRYSELYWVLSKSLNLDM